MIVFSLRQILLSCLYSAIYGFSFAVILIALLVLSDTLVLFFRAIRSVVAYEGRITALSAWDKDVKPRSRGWRPELAVGVGAFLYSVGYVLLSYYALDGAVRLYTFIIALLAVFFTYKLAAGGARRMFERVFFVIFCPLVLFLRILTYPLHKILNKRMLNQ